MMSGVRALSATANPELRTTCLILISTSSLFLHKYKDEAQALRPPTASFDQSKEEPADGHQSKQTASPGAKEIGHTVAARLGPVDPLAGDAGPARCARGRGRG